MKICHLVPGSGGTFYCQNCLRDYAMVRALRRQGHDAVMVPLYLPSFGGEFAQNGDMPLFFGGIGVYLRHHVPLFRRAPRWAERLLDSPWLLNLAAAREGSTNAAQLGPMTLSMLEGRGGFQGKEFDRLADWIATHERPDIIHLSNALLLGLATELQRVCGAPILCSLQDEEPWVEAMGPVYSRRCWEAMARHAARVHTFVATSEWYADRMRRRLGVGPERVTVVYPGVELEEAAAAELPYDPPALGFLSRLNEAQGFGVLADAFTRLKQDPALRGLRLRASGGYTSADRPFMRSQRNKLRRHGAEDAFDVIAGFQRRERTEFLRSVTVLSTPARQGEAFGLHLVEAMALGVPVVQPQTGAYPEIIAATGGGMLYDPAEPGALETALRSLLCDPARARELGSRGRTAVLNGFGVDHAAERMLGIYAAVLGSSPA